MNKRGKIPDFLLQQKDISTIKKMMIIVIIVMVALIIFFVYLFFIYSKPCKDSTCFFDAMMDCNRVNYIKEDSQASFLYEIKGGWNDCKIKITLLKMKEGTLEAEGLQGRSMNCIVPKGLQNFPEEDLSKCSGILKEGMQDIIIQNMHDYLVKNCAQIKEELNRI